MGYPPNIRNSGGTYPTKTSYSSDNPLYYLLIKIIEVPKKIIDSYIGGTSEPLQYFFKHAYIQNRIIDVVTFVLLALCLALAPIVLMNFYAYFQATLQTTLHLGNDPRLLAACTNGLVLIGVKELCEHLLSRFQNIISNEISHTMTRDITTHTYQEADIHQKPSNEQEESAHSRCGRYVSTSMELIYSNLKNFFKSALSLYYLYTRNLIKRSLPIFLAFGLIYEVLRRYNDIQAKDKKELDNLNQTIQDEDREQKSQPSKVCGIPVAADNKYRRTMEDHEKYYKLDLQVKNRQLNIKSISEITENVIPFVMAILIFIHRQQDIIFGILTQANLSIQRLFYSSPMVKNSCKNSDLQKEFNQVQKLHKNINPPNKTEETKILITTHIREGILTLLYSSILSLTAYIIHQSISQCLKDPTLIIWKAIPKILLGTTHWSLLKLFLMIGLLSTFIYNTIPHTRLEGDQIYSQKMKNCGFAISLTLYAVQLLLFPLISLEYIYITLLLTPLVSYTTLSLLQIPKKKEAKNLKISQLRTGTNNIIVIPDGSLINKSGETLLKSKYPIKLKFGYSYFLDGQSGTGKTVLNKFIHEVLNNARRHSNHDSNLVNENLNVKHSDYTNIELPLMAQTSPIYMPQGTTNTLETPPRLLDNLVNKIKAFNQIKKEDNLSELQLLVYNMILDENTIDKKTHTELRESFGWKGLIKSHMLEFFQKMEIKEHNSKQVIDSEKYYGKNLSGGEMALVKAAIIYAIIKLPYHKIITLDEPFNEHDDFHKILEILVKTNNQVKENILTVVAHQCDDQKQLKIAFTQKVKFKDKGDIKEVNQVEGVFERTTDNGNCPQWSSLKASSKVI